MMRAWRAIGFLLLLSAAVGPWSANGATEEQGPAVVRFEHFDSLRYDNKTGVAVLEGAVVSHDGARIAADRIEYDSNKRLGAASGHVRFEGDRAKVTSASARFDFGKRRAVFEGDVRLVTERAVEGSAPETTTTVCTKLEYFYRQRKGVATGPVRVEQADQRASGDAAIYDGEAETFRLVGSVVVKNDRGDVLEAESATLSLKDDTIEMGPGKAQFRMEEEAPPAE